ncbi:hypothetical protein G7Y89_g4768 [Cudoniella acicularis]|uniref:Uncharacterized protein n=1 Tax=Cudoniella acicularis TaxID=354080 RepID=A0A8H4RQU2_9HELO|nr:hypothetical protein G7Y89_g4768 [Cudoniella acicularis]
MQPNACAIRKIKDDMNGSQSGLERANGEGATEPPRRDSFFPPEFMGIMWSALQVGGLTDHVILYMCLKAYIVPPGASGLLVGAVAGIVRSSGTPTLFATATGIQWGALGLNFSAGRNLILLETTREKEIPTQRDKILSSVGGGALAGFVGGLLRGRKNIIPGTLMFALFGAAGQYMYNMADARDSPSPVPQDSRGKNLWMNSKWSPMKVLTDVEYEDMLREKLLRVNAQIALIDENIEALRAQERDMAARAGTEEVKMSESRGGGGRVQYLHVKLPSMEVKAFWATEPPLFLLRRTNLKKQSKAKDTVRSTLLPTVPAKLPCAGYCFVLESRIRSQHASTPAAYMQQQQQSA